MSSETKSKELPIGKLYLESPQKFSFTAFYEQARIRAEARQVEKSVDEQVLANLNEHLEKPRNLNERLAVFIAANRGKIASKIEQHYELVTETQVDLEEFEELIMNKFIFPEFAAQIVFENAGNFDLNNWENDKTALGYFLRDALGDFFEDLYPLFFKKNRLYINKNKRGRYITKGQCPHTLEALKQLGWDIPAPLTLASLQESLRAMTNRLNVSEGKKKEFEEIVNNLGVYLFLKTNNDEEDDFEEDDFEEENFEEFDNEEDDKEIESIEVHNPDVVQNVLSDLTGRLITPARLSTLGQDRSVDLPALSSLDDLHVSIEQYEELGRQLEIALIRKGISLKTKGVSAESSSLEDIQTLSRVITGGYEIVGNELQRYDEAGGKLKRVVRSIGIASLILVLTYLTKDQFKNWVQYIAYIFAGAGLIEGGKQIIQEGQKAIGDEYLSEKTSTGIENYLRLTQGALELKRLREAAYDNTDSAERETQGRILREAESMLVEELRREAPNLEEQLVKALEPGAVREDIKLRIGGIDSEDATRKALEGTEALLEDLAIDEAAQADVEELVKAPKPIKY